MQAVTTPMHPHGGTTPGSIPCLAASMGSACDINLLASSSFGVDVVAGLAILLGLILQFIWEDSRVSGAC